MLIQANAGREGQVRTHADEHPAPPAVVHIEVILHHPALGHLQMPAVVFLVSDGDHDAGWLTTLHDGYDLIRFRFPEVWVEELVAPVFGGFQNGRAPFLRTVDDPVLELGCDIA